ncbi:DNase I-like protein [Basidiobolus meristosporus CBS 931.73]|uniref:DNase I-like protein n=1 Tax=Basidiobolus meristosporus CBS 931.73 TaxID=1314790 RepID=A0A1Y1YRM8_9FUNG|nr:DNase I-like protein [Basidiobolus meristosporus CBS 931.73]|eukprot:ORY00626.1 DNase I-like protein [Basidiobolus meristosporus CBS 931.73]
MHLRFSQEPCNQVILGDKENMYTFSGDSWVPHEQNLAIPPKSYSQLRIVTYNIHFDKRNYQTRIKAVLHELKKQDADIVCLQEMIPLFLPVFLEDPWVQQKYLVSDIHGLSFAPYGVFAMTRLHDVRNRLRLVSFQSHMSRKLLILETTINGRKINFATSHFESLEYSKSMRLQQFKHTMTTLSDGAAESSLIVGDFNMCDEHEEDQIFPLNGFQDCWSLLRPEDLGHTMGVNYPHPKYRPIRFDRVKLRNETDEEVLTPISIHTFGGDAIEATVGHPVYPSDHLGICALFSVKGQQDRGHPLENVLP